MRKRMLFFHLAYYILSLVLYGAFYYGTPNVIPVSRISIGMVVALTYGMLFIATPIIVAILMRFSMLKWYVDPFAAAEIPLFLYIGSVIFQMNRSGIPFFQALLKYNEKLSADGGEGWFFHIGLFLFGLVASLSFARKRGESISYKLIAKISPNHGTQHDEGGCEQ